MSTKFEYSTKNDVIQAALSFCIRENIGNGPLITKPEDLKIPLTLFYSKLDLNKEHFSVVLLNTKNSILKIEVISTGSLNASIVHPREAFKPAIMESAAGVVFCHNHPSGDPTPSTEDIALVKRLMNAGKLLGITVLDSIILGNGLSSSFKSLGLII